MRAGPVLGAAWAGAARRLVQSVVVAAVLAVSSAAALTALTLDAAAGEAITAGVAVTHGPDLALTINAAKVSAARLAATRHLPGVTQDAGPYPETTIMVATGAAAAGKPGGGMPPTPLTVIGRSSPSGPLDDIVANPANLGNGQSRWPARPGEISVGYSSPVRIPLGGKLIVVSAPGRPALTVVGYADQAVIYEDAWVLPGEIARLRAAGAPVEEQMLYKFASDSTAAQIGADLAELKAALPPGAVASSLSLLGGPVPAGRPGGANVNTSFVVAFAILGLVLAVLITANVVSAAVIASYRRIGVLKSIGFTPAEVTAVYLAQVGIPAVAGAAAGVAVGNWWVLPVIGMYQVQGARVFVPLWINLAVPLGMLALAGLAAAVPAVRAGRLNAVEAITAGQAPQAGRGAVPYRAVARLGLPEPVTTGLAAPFSRPGRSAVMLLALIFGLTGVVLGTSLNTSIHKINNSAFQPLGQVQAVLPGESTTLTPGQDAAVRAAIRALPGTQHYVGAIELEHFPAPPGSPPVIGAPVSTVDVSLAAEPYLGIVTYVYNGDSSWLGWSLVGGRWYDGPGQIDVSEGFAVATGLTTGDSVTLTVNGQPVTVRIAGEVFIPDPVPTIWTSRQALGGQAAGLGVNQYEMALRPGTGIQGYISALQRAVGPRIVVGNEGAMSFAGYLDTSLFQWLTVLVGVLAGLGVLNAALMAARERVRDLGIFKAVGMSPRQVITMVICWVVAPAVVAAAVALPAGLAAQDRLITWLASAPGSAAVTPGGSLVMVLPGSFIHVLGGFDLLLLVLGGLGIAVAGALGPAGWAARTRTSAVLHTE